MVFAFTLLTGVLGILTEFIPSSKSPPRSIIGSASVYDSLHRRIITVGGIDSSTNEQTSNIYAFNLDEKVFEIFYILSDYKPKAYANHATFLRSDRKILCFGFNSGVASFDLNSNSWKQEEMTGNITLDVGSFGFTSFIFDDIEYVAIFGGTSETGIKNDLYLITVHSLFSQILPKNGDFPTPKSFVSMVFYEDALYIYGYTPFSEDIDDSIYKYDLNLEYWSKIEAKGTKPSPRLNAFLYVHNEEMILLYGAYLEFSEFYNELYKYNFKSNTWRQVVNFTGSIIGGSSSVKINNELYILYGRTFDEAKNSIQMIDLDEEIPNPIEITKNFLSPTRRINHCSLVFSHFMYMFGGFYDNHEDPQLIYNDMWKFDLEELIWESIITKGTRPPARKNNACCKQGGSRMFIFGGEDESTYMNDLYFYHQTYEMWYKVTPEGNSISERTGACMTSYLNLLFIVGGKSTDKGNNDLWVFDLETNQYKCLDNGRFDSDLVNSKCWIEESDGDLVSLLVVGGADIYQAVNINQYRISINTTSLTVKDFELSYSEQDGCYVKENSALINFGNKSIVFGGALNGFVAIFPLIIYDHSNMNCEFLDKVEDLVLYGHSAVHYKDAIYVFGGGGVTMFYISLVQVFNNIIKVTFDKDDTIKATCSEGSFGSKCDLCPKGEYMLDKKCKKCPTGTFNNILGSTNIDQCIPCDYGSFSNKPGSNYCYDCFSSYTCPIGSSYPKPKINSLKNATIQPSQYSSDQEYISEMSSLMWYSFGVFFLILLIFALFFQNASLFLKRTDFFVDSHEKPLDVPIVYIKTRIGGVFSLSFLLASCITIVITALNFNYDNIIEIRGTVPLIVLQEKVKSEKLEAEFTFILMEENAW